MQQQTSGAQQKQQQQQSPSPHADAQFFKAFVAGGGAGMLAALITCPVEVVKTKLQALRPRSTCFFHQTHRSFHRMCLDFTFFPVKKRRSAGVVEFGVCYTPRVRHRGIPWVFQRSECIVIYCVGS
jgi:hypothetical protein